MTGVTVSMLVLDACLLLILLHDDDDDDNDRYYCHGDCGSGCCRMLVHRVHGDRGGGDHVGARLVFRGHCAQSQ